MRIKPFQSRYAVTWDEYPTGISNPNGKVKMVNWCIKNLKLDYITLGFYEHNPNTVNSWMLINLSNDILITTEEDDVHLKLLDHGSLKAIILDDYSKACELADYVDQIHTFNIIKRY